MNLNSRLRGFSGAHVGGSSLPYEALRMVASTRKVNGDDSFAALLYESELGSQYLVLSAIG